MGQVHATTGTAYLAADILLLLKHLAQILNHELPWLQILVGEQAEALGSRPPLCVCSIPVGADSNVSHVTALVCKTSMQA